MATKETQEKDLEGQTSLYTGRRTSAVALTRGGEEVQVVLQQRKQLTMHDYVYVDGTLYDIPKEDEGQSVDGYNIVMQVLSDKGTLIPLAAATLSLIDGVPIITMIQRVDAKVETLPPQPSEGKSSSVRILSSYERIPHPLEHLQKGGGKT